MSPPPSRPRDFFTGIGLLGKGLGRYARSPGLMLLGMLPALLAFVLLAAAFVAVVSFIQPESRALTWFANGWPKDARDLVRILAAVAIIGVSGYLAIIVYTGLTLFVGDPFYEKISQRVEDQLGGIPGGAVNLPFWKELRRSVGESVRLVVFSAAIGILLFVGGLLPAVGQTVVPVIAAFVGGWAPVMELTGIPFARRGMRLRGRGRVPRQARRAGPGVGGAGFGCFLLPP